MKVNFLSQDPPQELNGEKVLKEGKEGLEVVFLQILLSTLILGLDKDGKGITLDDMGKKKESDLWSISLKEEHSREEFFNDVDPNIESFFYQIGIKEEIYKEIFFQEFAKEIKEVLSNGSILEDKNLGLKMPAFTSYFEVNQNSLESALSGSRKPDKNDKEKGFSLTLDRLLDDLLKVSDQNQNQNHRIAQNLSEVKRKTPFEQTFIKEEMKQFLEKFLKKEGVEVKDIEFRFVRSSLQEDEILKNLTRFMERALDRTQTLSVDGVSKINLSLRSEKDLENGLKVFTQQPINVSYLKDSYSVYKHSVYKNIDSARDDRGRSVEALFKIEKEITELIDQDKLIRNHDKKVEKNQILVFEDIFHETHTEVGPKRTEYMEILRLWDKEKISSKFLDFLRDLVIEARSFGEKRALLRVEPPELGTLELEIKVINREVILSIKADNPETLKQMQAGLEQIKQGLQEVGLNLREFQTQLYLGFSCADFNTERGIRRNLADGEERSELLRREDVEELNLELRNYKGRYYFVV